MHTFREASTTLKQEMVAGTCSFTLFFCFFVFDYTLSKIDLLSLLHSYLFYKKQKTRFFAARQLRLNAEGLSLDSAPIASLSIPEIHTTNAYVVDYTGFRMLVTTIPPIDEVFSLLRSGP